MHCRIELPLSAGRTEAEHQIKSVQRKWGYDWGEIDCYMVDATGQTIEVVRWIPADEAHRRITNGEHGVHEHFFGRRK